MSKIRPILGIEMKTPSSNLMKYRLTCSPEASHGVEYVVAVVVEDDGEVDGDGDERPLQHGGAVEGLERRRGEVARPADGPRLPRREPEGRRQGRRGDLVQRAQDAAHRMGTWIDELNRLFN